MTEHIHDWVATMEKVTGEAGQVFDVVAFTCECGEVLLEDAALMAMVYGLGSVLELGEAVRGGRITRNRSAHPKIRRS